MVKYHGFILSKQPLKSNISTSHLLDSLLICYMYGFDYCEFGKFDYACSKVTQGCAQVQKAMPWLHKPPPKDELHQKRYMTYK